MTNAGELVSHQETLYSSRNPTRRWLHVSRRDWIMSAIERYKTGSTSHALEIGPGSGVYLPILGQYFTTVVATDVEEAYLENARGIGVALSNLACKKDDILATKLPLRSFDLVLCTEVVEHLTDSRSAIQQMHALLRPGGVLILSTPQRYSPLEMAAKIAFLPGVIELVRAIYREPILETGHINLMTENTVREQIASAGFQIVEAYKTGVYIPLLAEFGGEYGLRFEKMLERALRNGSLSWLLWTQYYVARAQ